MNSEESRLRTFANWPEDAVVDPRRIAKAGFYYMGQGLEVQCFSCGGRIAEWNYGDKVMAKHISLDPRCPFVLNPLDSGNIPLVNNSRRQSSYHQAIPYNLRRINRNANSPYKSLEVRLTTFTTWPISDVISPESLAQSGFYYTQLEDKVQCAFCGGIVGNWKSGDDPDAEHQRHFPTCSVFKTQTVSNAGVCVRDARIEATNLDNLKEIGVFSHRIPSSPRYSTFEARLRTFSTWPTTLNQKPEQMAEAGFYFTGNRDKVRCFHCDGGLQLWEKDDEPWLEHAKWFSECGFVLLTKGRDFIEESIKTFAPTINKVEKSLDAKHLPMLQKICTVTEDELQELMNTPPAVAALQVGIEASRVKLAIKLNKEVTGEHFKKADDLIIAALDIQSEENTSIDLQEAWSTPPMSPAFRARYINPRNSVSPETSDESDDDEYVDGNSASINKILPLATNSLQRTTLNLDKSSVTLEEENRRLKEARLCKICMDSEVEIVLLPCGHLVSCVNCSQSLIDCPLCRQSIRATVRTFLS